MTPSLNISGELFIFVAFDWGDEIDLEQARRLTPAARLALPRRRRTPSSFTYRPAPLRIVLDAVSLDLAEIGEVSCTSGVTLFDFGAVSLALRVPFQLEKVALGRLAGTLADPTAFVQAARGALAPLYRQLAPAIVDSVWQEDLSEEYFVFNLPPEHMPRREAEDDHAWLAGLVHLESQPLSREEVAEALRLKLSYSPEDLFVPDWAAAVLIDRDCEETLQAIEFANLQLLEFRNIDNRLDESLANAARVLQPLAHSRLPFWRMYSRPLRVLGELKVEANALFERTSNSLKLVGDPYLGRVYRLLAARFHLETWEQNIQRKLEVAEGVYQVVSDQAGSFRLEFLEILVVVLIFIEIVLAFVRH